MELNLVILPLSASFQWKIDEKPVKIDKWDGAAVKNSLDDAAKKAGETVHFVLCALCFH